MQCFENFGGVQMPQMPRLRTCFAYCIILVLHTICTCTTYNTCINYFAFLINVVDSPLLFSRVCLKMCYITIPKKYSKWAWSTASIITKRQNVLEKILSDLATLTIDQTKPELFQWKIDLFKKSVPKLFKRTLKGKLRNTKYWHSSQYR